MSALNLWIMALSCYLIGSLLAVFAFKARWDCIKIGFAVFFLCGFVSFLVLFGAKIGGAA